MMFQWARELFEGLFKSQIENVNMYLSNPDYIELTQKQGAGAVRIISVIFTRVEGNPGRCHVGVDARQGYFV
jgi:hypothetical protein